MGTVSSDLCSPTFRSFSPRLAEMQQVSVASVSLWARVPARVLVSKLGVSSQGRWHAAGSTFRRGQLCLRLPCAAGQRSRNCPSLCTQPSSRGPRLRAQVGSDTGNGCRAGEPGGKGTGGLCKTNLTWCFYISLDKYSEVESLGHMVVPFLIFHGTSTLFSTVATPIYITSNST